MKKNYTRSATEIINNVQKALREEHEIIRQHIEVFAEQFQKTLLETTDDSLLDHDLGFETFLYLYEQTSLDENLLTRAVDAFDSVKDAWAGMRSGTQKATKAAIKDSPIDMGQLKSKQKAKLKLITKKLIESMYFDYNVILNSHHKQKTLYSQRFFNDVLDSFKLSPKVEKIVHNEFDKSIKRIVQEIRDREKTETTRRTAEDASYESPAPRNSQKFFALNKTDKQDLEVQIAELMGRLIGFTATVGIAEYFKTNVQARESIESYQTDNGHSFNQKLFELEYTNHSDLKALKDDRDWYEINEEELEELEPDTTSIYDKYCRGK